jgi:hypothetical protein
MNERLTGGTTSGARVLGDEEVGRLQASRAQASTNHSFAGTGDTCDECGEGPDSPNHD